MRVGIAAGLVLWVFTAAAAAATVPLEYESDITSLTTACALRASPTSVEEDGVRSATLQLAGAEYPVWIDPGVGIPSLEIDLDRDGTMESVEWERILPDGTWLAAPSVLLPAAESETALYRVLILWLPSLPVVVHYCRGDYRAGTFETSSRAVALALIDDNTDGTFDPEGDTLIVDVDGDGELLSSADSHERYALDEPFVVDGTTYAASAVASDGAWIEIDVAAESVAAKPPLLVGCPAPRFLAEDADGGSVDLGTLRGRIVLLDFWAAWCAPCLDELSTLVGIHEAFAEQGVVVVGINLDRSRSAFDAALERNGLPYVHIYDGPDGPVSSLYRIAGLPMTYLIGRDGVIRGRALRGDALVAALAALLDEEDAS